MIPLKDSQRTRRFPIFNVCLIVLNVIIYAYQLSLTRAELAEFIMRYGLIPSEVTDTSQLASASPANGVMWSGLTFITAMFLHAGWFHLGGNMLYLWVFGDNVEDRLGHWRYLLFYLLAGVVANLAHVLSAPSSTVPIIGASGAVAGVLGAYLISFPRSKVVTLVPIGFFLFATRVPALLFLFFWFLLQLANGILSLGVPTQLTQGVAWWAHVGGFLAGIVLLLVLRPSRVRVM